MTDNEFQILCLGFMLGAYVMLLVDFIGNAMDSRRSTRELQRVTRRLNAVSSWREAITVRDAA